MFVVMKGKKRWLLCADEIEKLYGSVVVGKVEIGKHTQY